MDCIFCKIVNNEISCRKLYEDDVVLAFLDNNPDSNGHTLIIPKKHFIDLDDIDLATLNHINKIAKMLKKELEEKLHCDGISLLQNNGSAQEVKHYHLHIKPYYKDKKSIEIVKNNNFIDDPETIYNIIKNID